jgi:hypothetical protein
MRALPLNSAHKSQFCNALQHQPNLNPLESDHYTRPQPISFVFKSLKEKLGGRGYIPKLDGLKTKPTRSNLANQLSSKQIAKGFPPPNQAEPVSFNEDFRRSTPRIVVRRLAHPISPSHPNRQNLARFHSSHRPIAQKTVPGLTHRTNNIHPSTRHAVIFVSRNPRNRVHRAIKRRPNQIIHGCVHNHKRLAAALFHVDDPRKQHACGSDDRPPWLE